MSAETYSSHHSQFVGVYYAIPAIGGFNIEQHFGGPIPIIVSDIPAKDLDLTLALQLRINVKTFNDKLEIVKDASNNTVISSPFDISGGSFPSPISFDFKEFITDITSDNIISLGNFSTMNSDFRRNIVNYYKLSKDVNVFDPSGESQNTGSTITNDEFIDLFSVDPSSNTTNDISGNMSIYYIPQLMSGLYENDPFNNRSNKTIEHGFIAGDIIFLENGLSVRLDLLNESVPPISGVSEDINYDSMVILSKIYTAPLVLHLDNI
tara:strand:+ start:67 stop:861 length:795 start_codon:yes stop_codon:yes gene_type:complete